MIEELERRDVQEFIETHLNDNPAALVLKSAKYSNLPIKLIAHQILCKQKAKVKLPFLYSTPDIIYPQGVSLEQTSSEATARYKSKLLVGSTITDLTGGFGIDTFFFSKSFDKIHYVESNSNLANVVKKNFDTLNLKNVKLHSVDCLAYLQSEKTPTDCYYIDPARRDADNKKVFSISDCQPDLSSVLPSIKKRGSSLLIKLSPLLDIHQALKEIPNVAEVHVLATNNECKELLFKVESGFDGETNIFAVNLLSTKREQLKFTYQDELTLPKYGLPENYLYEPNAAIMKAGGFNTVANAFSLTKLHRNSHLYTSKVLIDGFPGRVFKIDKEISLNKKKLKAELPEFKANITVRNYPMTVKELRTKTRIKEGGDIYLFGTTLSDGRPSVLSCSKLN